MSNIVPGGRGGYAKTKSLTAREAEALKLARSGLSIRQIAKSLGIKACSVGNLISVGASKEQILLLRDRAPEQGTSLRRARGNAQRPAG